MNDRFLLLKFQYAYKYAQQYNISIAKLLNVTDFYLKTDTKYFRRNCRKAPLKLYFKLYGQNNMVNLSAGGQKRKREESASGQPLCMSLLSSLYTNDEELQEIVGRIDEFIEDTIHDQDDISNYSNFVLTNNFNTELSMHFLKQVHKKNKKYKTEMEAQIESLSSCTICLGDNDDTSKRMNNMYPDVKNICNCIFHEECIQAYFASSSTSGKCPNCNLEVIAQGEHHHLNLENINDSEELIEENNNLNSDLSDFENVLDISQTNLDMIDNIVNNEQQNHIHFIFINTVNYIPESIGNFINLRGLSISKCENEVLPESIGNLVNITFLEIFDCEFEELPESIGNLNNLEMLEISNSKIKELPDSIGNLSKLNRLSLDNNNDLETLPESISQLHNLSEISLINNQNLEVLPESITTLELKSLEISGNTKLTISNEIQRYIDIINGSESIVPPIYLM